MYALIVVATLAAVVGYALYAEHRKKLRIPLIILIVINGLVFVSPHIGCAVKMPLGSIGTLDWKVISFQYDVCLFENKIQAITG